MPSRTRALRSDQMRRNRRTSQARMRGPLGVTPLVIGSAACSSVSSGVGSGSQGQQIHFTPVAAPIDDGNGHALQKFVAPTDPGAGGFVFTVSGEVNALTGYPYPPFDPSQTWMVDGWNWRIEKYIVVIDHITLWSDPHQSVSD